MDSKIAIQVINKAIANTNSLKMGWTSLSLRPSLLNQKTDDVTYPPTAVSVLKETVYFSKSFYASFQNGYIFLLTISRKDPNLASLENILDNIHYLSLQLQKDSNSYAEEITNSNVSSEIAIQLKRLYNLVESNSSGLNGFISDFLNS